MSRLIKYQAKGAFLEPTEETFKALEQAIQWAEVDTPRNLRKAMSALTRHMAILNQGFAREMSFGPYDPSGKRPDVHYKSIGHRFIGSVSGPSQREQLYEVSQTAWKIPVRRITGRYYLGWKVRGLGPGVWQLYNDSREAYYIEFGIHTSLRRVRRPIRKLSLRKTMDFMMRTEAYHRIWIDAYTDPKYLNKGMGFTQYVSGAGAAVTGKWQGAYIGFGSELMFGQRA